MLRRAEVNRSLIGVVSCQHGVHISHLLFADDSLLFYQATVQECQVLLNILAQYESASGQAINRQKTSLFFSRNTKQDTRDMIRSLLGARIMTDCEKYLGLPMVGGRAKTTTFREIQERVAKRVLGWKEKFISKAGREILIKTVAQSIPTYSMGLFKLPKAMCNAINSTLANYWWGQKYDERKIHWVCWQKLCTDKNRGGMGFQDINAFNLAMLAKQAWCLLQGTQSLFYRVYKAY